MARAGVTLILDGLTLTSADTASITCGRSSQVTIEAAAGTVNMLSDSEQNNDDMYPTNENAENAVLKCKDGSQVTLCGTGVLTITANGKNGIKSGASTDEDGETSLTIRELTLTIDAPVNDAINAGTADAQTSESQSGFGDMPGGRPGSFDPNGEAPAGMPNGETPPALPDDGGTPPEKPDGAPEAPASGSV